MGLLDTILGIAERSWKDKPRKEVVQSFVILRYEMIRCQRYYEEYSTLREKCNVDEWFEQQLDIARKTGTAPPYHPRFGWIRSLRHVLKALHSLDAVLSIFSPDTRKAMNSYGYLENLEATAVAMWQPMAAELGEPLEFSFTSDRLEPTFKAALEQLDRFIKENFKTEEVFAAAQKSEADDIWR